MKLVVHIGGPKTGTTSIQNICALQRHRLAQQGILYPRSLGETKHELAAVCATPFLPGFTTAKVPGITSPQALDAFRIDTARQLQAEVDASGCDTLLISNENLFEKTRSQADLDRFFSFLPAFDSVRIIAYLRHQVDFAAGVFSELVRMGTAETRQKFLNSDRSRTLIDYYGALAVWADRFGDRAVIARPYDRAQLSDGDSVVDFLGIMGIDRAVLDDDRVTAIRRSRQRLDLDATAFLEAFNGALETELARRGQKGRMRAYKHIDHRTLVVDALERLASSGTLFSLSRAQAADVMRQVKAGNQALERRFNIALPPPPRVGPAGKSRVSSKDMLRHFAAMWIETDFPLP